MMKKWKLTKSRQRDKEVEMEEHQPTTTTTTTAAAAAKKKKMKKKASSNSSNSSPSSSSSSSFSISHLLPLSWLASILKTSKRNATTSYSRSTPKACYSRPPPPPSPRRPPETVPGRHVPTRLPPPVTAADVPHRRSLGDDGGARPRGTDHPRADPRRWRRHHHSVGDLDLTTLGHLIPFSVRSRAVESDSGSDGSADTDARNGHLRRPQLQRRRFQRQISKAVRPSDTDSGDVVLPLRSFGGRIRQPRARAKVRVSSPRRTPTPPPARRRRRRELERFAVVTRSRDPLRDFRESMVEMIWEKGIGRPEELEDLLACYLSLNAEEHHDVIVKVFRQVWFELKPDRFPPAVITDPASPV